MVKVSKAGKARIKRMTKSEVVAILKAGRLLTDAEIITPARFVAIERTVLSYRRGPGI
jgi:hypothetical protein